MSAHFEESPALIDIEVVRQHVGLHHAQAARALQGAYKPGLLQLVLINPARAESNVNVQRFAIGDVEGMAAAACNAPAGWNVYVEGRTVRDDLRGTSARGGKEDTRGVFALVVDSDADKGRGGRVVLQPSLVIETSPGNRHDWLFLEKALGAEEATQLGDALRAATGADADTGVVTQPYRLAGTPNYPDAQKLARGRAAGSTRISSHVGTLWASETLRARLPKQERAKAEAGEKASAEGKGRADAFQRGFMEAEFKQAATPAGDRSAQFQKAVNAARSAGLNLDETEEIARSFPQGCSEKYLAPRDRLRRELERSWGKVEERAERDETEAADVLGELNAKHSVVSVGGKIRVMSFEKDEMGYEGPVFQSVEDFRNRYMNREIWVGNPAKLVPLGVYWLRHPERRQYEGVFFDPDAEAEVDGRLNLWRGFGIKSRPGDWSLMRQHIRGVLASGDAEADEYIIRWCAWTVQNPGRRAEVALVLRGGRGTGKGTLGNALHRIFGAHGVQVSSAEQFVGRFNAHLRTACFFFADEAYWAGDKGAEGQLKRAITEPTLLIEQKGIDATIVRNCLHVLMASNESWVVPVGEAERRFAVFEVSNCHRQDASWFKPLNAQLDEGGLEAMLHDLLGTNLGDWHPREVPKTAGLREQQARSLSPEDEWLVGLLQDGMLPGADPRSPNRAASGEHYVSVTCGIGERRERRRGLLDHAKQSSPRLRNKSHNELGSYLKSLGCSSKKVFRQRGWEFPPLPNCRRAWETRFPGWTWNDPSLIDWEGEEE